jgi:hypothetical protein
VQEVAAAAGSARRTSDPLHFGLGHRQRGGSHRHPWPSGSTQTIEPAANRHAASGKERADERRRHERDGPGVAVAAARRGLTIDNRYLPPLLITSILAMAHVAFGILEGWERTALAIRTAIGAELVMGRITYGSWPNPVSAYKSGHQPPASLVRSPFWWAVRAHSASISIASKCVLLPTAGDTVWDTVPNFGVSGGRVPGATRTITVP